MEGKITRFWLAERQNLLAPVWLSAPFLHLVGFLKSFVQNFLTQRSLQILTFKPTYSVEMHGNQAIAWRECKKGEPKASNMDSKRLFVLKAKTLELQGAFVCLKKFACCSHVPRPLSHHYGFLQARRKQAQSFLKEIVNILINGLKEPVKVSGRNCSASSFGLIICSFYRHVQSFTTYADAGEQI